MTPRFAYLGLIAAVFCASSAAIQPVLPRYVKTELHRSNAAVGVVAGATALGALLIRIVIARWGSRLPARTLLVFGTALAGVVLVVQRSAHSVAALIPLRILFGAGNGAAFLGVLTLAMLFTVPARRGEAATLALVTVHVGIGTGPILGEWLLERGSYELVWLVSGLGMLAAALLATGLRPPPRFDGADAEETGRRARGPLLHREAVFPGVVNALGQLSFVGFATFVPLYGKQIGLDNVALVFLTVSATMVIVRLVGVRLPDRMGPMRGGKIALSFLIVGLLTAAIWASPLGLYVAAVILGCGTALLYPTLMVGAVAGVPESERAGALATFSLFQDLSIALGGAFNGAVASVFGYRGSFVVGAGLCALDMILISTRGRRGRHEER